jgi:hypothetical protein
MTSIVRLLAENPLLLLFLVAAIGYPLGQLRVAGTNLGVGAVLFAGLAVGSLDPSLRLPDIVSLLGLVPYSGNLTVRRRNQDVPPRRSFDPLPVKCQEKADVCKRRQRGAARPAYSMGLRRLVHAA